MRHGYRTLADLTYKGDDPNPYRENYYKKTNAIEDDWTGLFDLTYALSETNGSDEQFLAQVEGIVNIEQWTRFMAADTLVGNREKGLYSGMGDDYALYAGTKDRRFWLVPHDLDTVLGQGDEGYVPDQDILSYQDVPGLARLMNHPDVKALYFEQLRDMKRSIFTPEAMNTLIDDTLGDWVPAPVIDSMKLFVLERRYHVFEGSTPQVPRN
jgi:spore coat protein CotH